MCLSGMYLQLVIIPKREALRQAPTCINLQTVYKNKQINKRSYISGACGNVTKLTTSQM